MVELEITKTGETGNGASAKGLIGLAIAKENGATYELFSNTSIPENIKKNGWKKRY